MLGLKPSPRVSSLARLQAASPGAYREYVQGTGLLQGWKDLQNPDAAIPLLEQANGAAPGNAAVQTALCQAYRLKYQRTSESGWLDAADVPCRRAPEADPGFVPALIERGDFRVQRGDVQGGIQDLERAFAMDPASETATGFLAAAYDAAGLHEKAEAMLQKAAQANPNSWNAYYKLGEIYLRSGRLAEAAGAFQRATQLAPENNGAWTRLGSSLSKGERLAEAEKAFLHSLQIAPTFPAYANLGNLYLRQERLAEAGVAYEKALEKNPKQQRIWGNLAAAYSRMPGKQDQSRDAYRRAAELCRAAVAATPDDAVAISDLASYEAFAGERAEPLALIQKALALAPKDLEVLYNGVEVYEYLGFREQALLWMSKLLEQGFPAKDLGRSVVLSDLRRDRRYQELVTANVAHPPAGR
jgi:serine/threonine-protein kinase